MNSIMKLPQMNDPFYTFNNSINYYSLLHFAEYGVLSLIPFVKLIHVAIISVSWEVLELFLQQEWANESGGNKIFDLIFNFLGFLSGKFLIKQYQRKKSISL